MARYAVLTLDDKIDRAKMAVERAKQRYEQLQGELDELIEARDNERKEELILAVSRSRKSFDEILAFLNCDECEDTEPEETES